MGSQGNSKDSCDQIAILWVLLIVESGKADLSMCVAQPIFTSQVFRTCGNLLALLFGRWIFETGHIPTVPNWKANHLKWISDSAASGPSIHVPCTCAKMIK